MEKGVIKLLNLEDNPGDFCLIQEELKDYPFPLKIKRASCKEEYCGLIQTFIPDLILSDYSIPGYDGKEALKYAKKHVPLSPFIFVSGTLSLEKAVEALKEGAADFLLKENLPALSYKITRALREKEEKKKRKEAEQKLIDAKDFSESIFNAIKEPVIVFNQNKEVVIVNYSFFEFFQIKKESLVFNREIGNIGLQNAGLWNTFQQFVKKVLVDKYTLVQKEVRFTFPKIGTKILIPEVQKIRMPDNGGEPFLLLILKDVTEKKALEKEFENFFTLSPDMFCVTDFKGYFKKLNTAWTKVLGYSEAELKARPFMSFIHPDDIDKTRKAIEDTLKKGRITSFENRYKSKSGEYRWFLWSAIVLTDMKVAYGMARDITERKSIEKAIYENEQRLELALAGGGLGVWEADMEAECIKYEKRDKRKADELEGFERSIPEVLEMIHPDDREKLLYELNSLKAAEKSGFDVEFRVKTHFGNWRWIAARGKIFEWDDDGNPGKLLGTFLDISERKRTTRLLKERNKELETFIYKASHDLKGPLSSTLGLLQIAQKDVRDKKALNYLSMIRKTNEKLNHILDTLTQVVLIKQGTVSPESIDLSAMIYNIFNEFKYYPGFSGIRFILENNMQKRFSTDKALLETILRNLVENAIKYARNSREKPFVRIKIDKPNHFVHIEFSDNGIGIDTGYQEHVFDMFYRANKHSKGVGLGLYMVKNAIDKLRGTIHLSSEKNKGTTFRILLPDLRKLGAETKEGKA